MIVPPLLFGAQQLDQASSLASSEFIEWISVGWQCEDEQAVCAFRGLLASASHLSKIALQAANELWCILMAGQERVAKHALFRHVLFEVVFDLDLSGAHAE